MRKMNRKFMKSIAKKLTASVLAGGMLLSLAACGSNVQTTNPVKPAKSGKTTELTNSKEKKEVKGKEADEKYKKAVANVTVNLLKECQKNSEDPNANLCISPTSMITLMALAGSGAKNQTLKEIEDAIADGMTIDELDEYLVAYNNKLQSSEEAKFHMANSIWVNENTGIAMKADYLKKAVDYFSAQIYSSPFDENTVTDINGWVDKETDGMIKKLFEEMPADVAVCLVNALAFEGKWEVTYEDYQEIEDYSFTNINGKEEFVTMLSSEEGIYLSDENATGFVKYYKGGEYAFVALLPNQGITVDEYVMSLTGEQWLDLYENCSYEPVNVLMPEFESEYSASMNDVLQALGVNEAYDMGNADFSDMGEIPGSNIYVGDVVHKTYIKVDKEGTKAAAATGMTMECNSIALEEPKSVVLDRPFVYAVVDTESGLPLFIGTTKTIEK